MTFGDGIKALLDTYANCISLLKTFRRGRDESAVGSVGAQQQHSHLRKCLKSDRSLVERAYSSRVSESGKRFKRGDARAMTAMDRILKRLRDAITNLLRLSSRQDGLDLDYESLMSLSNASRVEAIKAIDSLSRRLGSPSRSSVASSSSKKSAKSSSAARHKHKRGSSSTTGSSASKQTKATRQQDLPSRKPRTTAKEGKTSSRQPKRKAEDAERLRNGPPPLSRPPPTVQDTQTQAPISRIMSPSPEASKSAWANRISILSFSSGSTKLGEIPQRRWQSVMQYAATDPDGDEYNVRPMFPLKPYTAEVKERRFWGLFSRRREG
ncbi:hypothetical protein C8A03DRAFT_12488 [Achaetomium macrosporum]|uniref:Uncharacterized protein n=1 Tax=Achaetomium macrosporum TaxID=79813 RepID=A0AAN7CI26_9PEZI|nr:hypothetical protein C8A03DRAFT_12488 [Achaetomium macrosporum]